MRIAVAGAGIAGLTAAIALARRGFTVDLFERSARPEEVGAGIQLSPNATATFGPGQTVSGKEQIRDVWLTSKAFKPETNWLSDHPAYKLVATVDGDRGTLRFECHFVDMLTHKIAAVTGGATDVARIDERWLITNFVGATVELKR